MTRVFLRTFFASILVLSLGIALGACESEGGASAFSCTMEGMACTEYSGSGYDSMGMQDSCNQANGTFSLGPCMLTNAVGRCLYDAGGTSEHSIIYYTGVAETYESDCEDGGGTWTPMAG